MPTANSTTPSVYISAVSIECSSSVGHRLAARSRAQASAASTSSTVRSVWFEGTSCVVAAPEHALDGRHDVGEPGLTVEERRDAHLVGGVVDGRRGSAERPGLPGQRDRGERLVVEREELPGLRPRPVHRGCGVRHPVGPAQPERDRDAASTAARPAPASSRRRTRPSSARPRCGCTTTSIRSKGMPNSRCASITSSPLLTRVAELMVTRGPIDQVGCASACSGVTSCSSSRARPRNGPPLAVSTRRRTSSATAAAQALRQRAVLGVDRARSDPGLARAVHDRAADDQRLLVGQRQDVAGLEGGQRGPQPDRAGDAVEHHVALEARRPRWTPPRRGRRSRGELLDLRRRTGRRCPPPGGEADDPEPVRVRAHDVEGLRADRAGRAEHDDVTAVRWRSRPHPARTWHACDGFACLDHRRQPHPCAHRAFPPG